MINWKVRIKNPTFWVTAIPTILLIVELVASLFGITLNLGDLGNKLLEIVRLVFVLLALLGIVNDPTTANVYDSSLAMTYSEPKKEDM